VCEAVVDYVKHSFIAKFNRLHVDLYSIFGAILSHDVLTVRRSMPVSSGPSPDRAPALAMSWPLRSP
jgi:hypothetical protein